MVIESHAYCLYIQKVFVEYVRAGFPPPGSGEGLLRGNMLGRCCLAPGDRVGVRRRGAAVKERFSWRLTPGNGTGYSSRDAAFRRARGATLPCGWVRESVIRSLLRAGPAATCCSFTTALSTLASLRRCSRMSAALRTYWLETETSGVLPCLTCDRRA